MKPGQIDSRTQPPNPPTGRPPPITKRPEPAKAGEDQVETSSTSQLSCGELEKQAEVADECDQIGRGRNARPNGFVRFAMRVPARGIPCRSERVLQDDDKPPNRRCGASVAQNSPARIPARRADQALAPSAAGTDRRNPCGQHRAGDVGVLGHRDQVPVVVALTCGSNGERA